MEPKDYPFYALLPSAITPPEEGAADLAEMVGATIIRIGTTDPGLVEGGGLIIDYRRPDQSEHRLVLAFSERGMWVQR